MFSDNDIQKTKDFLDSLKSLAYADSTSFEELAREFSDDKFTSSFGIILQMQQEVKMF